MHGNFPLNSFLRKETPFYYYDCDLLISTLNEIIEGIDSHPFHVHYAIKANPRKEILEIISGAGLGADVVSGGEIRRALESGFTPDKIVFAGVGKTRKEISMALKYGIGCFNAESIEEVREINSIAEDMEKIAPIALRINPNIDAHTHKYITTGISENKFGIDKEMLDEVIAEIEGMQYVALKGIHFHIGSQITDMEPYRKLCEVASELNNMLWEKGIKLETINVGGGLGIDYENPDATPIPDFKTYFKIFETGLKLFPNQSVHFELGRSVIGQCGSLISRVTYVKKGRNKKFVILDAGMNDLLRPALYAASHKIENLTPNNSSQTEIYDVVGPICESSDVFAKDLQLPEVNPGDLIAIRSAGAYGESMASQYNCRLLPDALLL